jgi:N-acylglucosamine 2-epimerase
MGNASAEGRGGALDDPRKLGEMLRRYESVLRDDCVPFWMSYGIDHEYGGCLTWLDRRGRLYSTDKSVWFQGRTLWVLSRLCHTYGVLEEWVTAASHCYRFLRDHCFDQDGRMFFQVTRDGRPVRKRRYFFSETFAAIGCAEYARLTGDHEALRIARQTYDLSVALHQDPSSLPPKYNPRTVRERGLAVPMILLATAQVLRETDPELGSRYHADAAGFADEVVNTFRDPHHPVLHENVSAGGEAIDSPRGRLVNPGHSIEAAWFLLTEAIHREDLSLQDVALAVLEGSLEVGWDREYGGLFSFIDLEGRPPEQLEWDMKLWWPHTEALYATLLAYHRTGRRVFADWFAVLDDYTFTHFPDPDHGEWFGYLHRDGSVSNEAKGNVFKGPFHIPRALLLCARVMRDLISGEGGET